MQRSEGFGMLMHPGSDNPHVDAIIKQLAGVNRAITGRLQVKEENEEVTIGMQLDVGFKSVVEDGKIIFLLDD